MRNLSPPFAKKTFQNKMCLIDHRSLARGSESHKKNYMASIQINLLSATGIPGLLFAISIIFCVRFNFDMLCFSV